MREKNLRVPRGSWTHDLALARCANALPLVKGDSGSEFSNSLGPYVSIVAIGGPV